MKVIIDRMNCVSCATCWETCPELFEQNTDDSFSQIIEKYRISGNKAEGEPPGELEDCAVEAADLCPATVIEIVA